MERPAFGPQRDLDGPDLPYRVYSDGTVAGLWQYCAETFEDAVDCAWGLYLDQDYRAVYVTHQGREVFRADARALSGASAAPRARLSALA